MITGLFTDFLVISVTISLVIIGLITLTPLLRKHYSAKLSYWIWLILTLRLLLPFNFSFTNPPVAIQLPEGQYSNCLSKLSVPEFAGGYVSNLSAGPDRGCKPYPFYN